MITVVSSPLELRGIVTKPKKSGGVYYIVNVENADGTAHALYCPRGDALPQGLKKADMVLVTFELSSYNGEDRYSVVKVEKVEE